MRGIAFLACMGVYILTYIFLSWQGRYVGYNQGGNDNRTTWFPAYCAEPYASPAGRQKVHLTLAGWLYLPPTLFDQWAIHRTRQVTSRVLTQPIDRVQAAKIASGLKFGMREEAVEKILVANGLVGSFKVGCSHGWTSTFPLSDGCMLSLGIAPQEAKADGEWANGLLHAAKIQSNGITLISIALTNAH